MKKTPMPYLFRVLIGIILPCFYNFIKIIIFYLKQIYALINNNIIKYSSTNIFLKLNLKNDEKITQIPIH